MYLLKVWRDHAIYNVATIIYNVADEILCVMDAIYNVEDAIGRSLFKEWPIRVGSIRAGWWG